MKLHPWQQEAIDSLREHAEQAVGGKTLMLRSIMRGSGKHIQTMENIKRVYPDYNMSVSDDNWPSVCVYDELTSDVVDDWHKTHQKFRLETYRANMANPTSLVDIKRWLSQSVFTLNRVQRHPSLMTLDDWRAISATDLFYKAVYTEKQPQTARFNRLLTIYWHNYYMDDLQGTLNDDTLSLLANGCKVDAYELFNTVPRLTYVRYCIAKAIVFRGNDNANLIS